MDLGVLLESPQGVSPRLEWGHARDLSSRAVGAVTPFPSCVLRDLCLSLEAFTRGFPTRLSHDAFPPGFPTRLSPSDVPRSTVVSVDPWFESRGSAGETGFPGMD